MRSASITLNNGMICVLDGKDAPRLRAYRWYALKRRSTFYAGRYVKRDGRWTVILMHREILGARRGQTIDHRDHNGLNNRRKNLRRCSLSQNNMNSRTRRSPTKTSRFKGVAWDKGTGRWVARLYVNYKQIWLGRHRSEEAAALAYDGAALKRFGRFALVNFPRRAA